MNLEQILVWIVAGAIPVLFAITVHEVAHGYVAAMLGDPTAKMLGRLTLNPIKHIDPVGTILLPLGMVIMSLVTMGTPMAFGWAKPIPVNTRNLKRPRRDFAIVAIAGPLSNLLMAAAWTVVLMLIVNNAAEGALSNGFVKMAQIGLVFNLVLLVLNLLPIPPLDGGRVLAGILPRGLANVLDRIEPYGMMILIALIVTGGLEPIMSPFLTSLYQFFLTWI